MPPALTVMTYNIHLGRDAGGVLDLDRIADTIRAQGADMAALQEVGRHWSADSDFRDQAADLGHLLEMEFVFGANLDRDPLEPGAPRRQYGTAILSSWPVLDSEHILLPRTSSDNERRGKDLPEREMRGTLHRSHDDMAGASADDCAIARSTLTPVLRRRSQR